MNEELDEEVLSSSLSEEDESAAMSEVLKSMSEAAKKMKVAKLGKRKAPVMAQIATETDVLSPEAPEEELEADALSEDDMAKLRAILEQAA